MGLSHRGAWIASGCARKQKHTTQGKAEAHARALNKRDDTTTFVAYPCMVCSARGQTYWHVGHKFGTKTER